MTQLIRGWRARCWPATCSFARVNLDDKWTTTTTSNCAETRNQFGKLISACKRKDLSAIRELVNERPKLISCHDKHARNVLHYAVILTTLNNTSNDKSDEDEQAARCLDCFRFLLDRCSSRAPEGLAEGLGARMWAQADLDGLTILHLAVISCNSLLVREILSSQQQRGLKSLVDVLDKEHHSPLHWAVITNNLQVVKQLTEQAGVRLAHQADLNGATPLHYATQTSDYPKYRQQLRQMLKNSLATSGGGETSGGGFGAPAGSAKRLKRGQSAAPAVESEPDFRSTRLERVDDNLDILSYLTRLPAIQLECRDRDARTPLLWAASSGNRQAVAILLAAGADSLARDANQLGALHCASSHGFIECLECLLPEKGNSSKSAEHINQADNLSCTPLFYAVLSGNIDAVELLLERGARHDWQDVKGRTAAHFAALKGQLNILKLLEAHGANLWLANKQGDLPLHYAIKSGRQQVVAWLLEHSPYERAVNAINNAGRAPIHLALLKASAPMVEFLLERGANVNQLVKVRDKTTTTTTTTPARSNSSEVNLALVNRSTQHAGKSSQSSYRYETALDMARRLAPQSASCLELLLGAGARPAADVLSSRRQALASNRSVFDLQAADVASPIGFETTSGSSAEPQSERAPVDHAPRQPAVPRLPSGPAPLESAITSDSTPGSSPLSQADNVAKPRGVEDERTPTRVTPTRPFKGGLKYQNEHMNASIKCKLYNNNNNGNSNQTDGKQARSFPPLAMGATKRTKRFNSDAGGGQEIVTNVNVFTSPIRSRCDSCSREKSHDQYGELSTTASSESDDQLTTSESSPTLLYDEEPSQSGKIVQQSYVPPSQTFSQNLPVILSAEEERSTSGDTAVYDGDNRTARGRAQYREVTSPVAEYIHQQRPASLNRTSDVRGWNQQQPYARTDYSQVRAKVDSGGGGGGARNDSGMSSQHFGDELDRRSKSWSTLDGGDQLPVKSRHAHSRSPGHAHELQESPTRQAAPATIIKTRRLSVDSVELASSVEKSIRKYKQETKLFEELQNLKKSQIRSGRANEALLVKRLVERFRHDAHRGDTLIGLDSYRGPYTYQAYELYLYDQLRKLSQMNEAKLVGARVPHKFTGGGQQEEPARSTRDYLEEDMRAELELQQVINRSENDVRTAEIAIEPSGALEEIRVRGDHDERAIVQVDEKTTNEELEDLDQLVAASRRAANSSASSSRRSSVEVEREKVDNLPLRVGDAENESIRRQLVEAQASDLTAAIITDALGNVSRATSRVGSRANSPSSSPPQSIDATASAQPEPEAEKDTETREEATSGPPASGPPARFARRRSVVNIGNKMEVIYHNVGIEIEPVAEGDRSDDDNEPSAAPAPDETPSPADQEQPEVERTVEPEAEVAVESIEPEPEAEVKPSEPEEEVPKEEEAKEVAPADDLRARPLSISRRASSPPAPEKVRRESSSGDKRSSRHASISETTTIATNTDPSPARKVFTGYDLDKLHETTRTRQQRLSRGQSQVEVDEQQQTSEAKKTPPKKRASRSPARKLRARSRPPPGPYQVIVPVGQVEERWRVIKRQERLRLREFGGGGRQDDQLQTTGMSHAKSQPNLKEQTRRGQSAAAATTAATSTRIAIQEEEDDDQGDDCSNFTLIYEVNKGRVKAAGSSRQVLQDRRSQAKWCQRKIAKIVDVRTLKRTLSLPESLMYSNDLLKRFTILKL